MEQLDLVHEDIYDALRTCVQAAGGAKVLGHRMWPELMPDKAGNRLTDALNPAKRDVLNAEQILLILREARKVNCHVGMYFITDDCDYQRPPPIEPEDEIAMLQREFMNSVKTQEALTKRLEQMISLRAVKATP